LVKQVWIDLGQASTYDDKLVLREPVYVLVDDMSGNIFTLLVKPAGADHNTIGFFCSLDHPEAITAEEIVDLCTRISVVVTESKGRKEEYPVSRLLAHLEELPGRAV
jgi:hypothetical protein